MSTSRRLGATPPLFTPETGQLVRAPEGAGPGWWAGAPGVFHDADTGRFYLTYRLRGPRPQRGWVTRIAVSADGRQFTDLNECRKEQLDSLSIERCALLRGADGRWHWYLSFVDPQTNQWRIDRVEADRPELLDPAQRQPLYTAADLPDLEGIKDPYLFQVGRLTYLLASVALTVEVTTAERASQHATGDVFNTGLTVSGSGLAVSHDARHFRWLGVIDPERGQWDRYCLRMNSVLWTPPVFTAWYDGSAAVEENYEERCGLAQSLDLEHWQRVSVEGPIITVPHASGSVRYVDCLTVDGRTWFYYEMARPDGAHELRVSVA